MKDSFKTKASFELNNQTYHYFNLKALDPKYNVDRLPFSMKILLENLLRTEDNEAVLAKDIEAILNWDAKTPSEHEIAFTPSRVILQDFTGVPAVVDLAAMRDAMKTIGGDPKKINPLSPAELVIDHSVMVDFFASQNALTQNTALEIERNKERYQFLRWGQQALNNFRVVPPGTGIVHQVNLEYLARVVFENEKLVYPDSLVGTDSHTTMINGVGVLGWGVGGIEAEAAMLGQPVTMLIPEIIGFELKGELTKGATATDLVLTVTQILRKHGVVGKFVEFFGEGLTHLPLADRATIANMAPEYGATVGIFPIDNETLDYLRLTGRTKQQVDLIETYCKKQGLFWDKNSPNPQFSETLSLDLSTVEPCIAGPKRPQDRVLLKNAKSAFQANLQEIQTNNDNAATEGAHVTQEASHSLNGNNKLKHGDVVIAAITSCTNTSNPAVMIAAGLVARAAKEKGLTVKPWVKTSLAPGSQVVTDYLNRAGLMPDLEAMGFNLVGYGCTTCIGNSGPLPEKVSKAIHEGNLAVSAVLSGNRNFEGRIHPDVRYAYLASPPLVVVYALAGTMDIDLYNEPLGYNKNNQPVYLKDVWPNPEQVAQTVRDSINPDMYRDRYKSVFDGDKDWQSLVTSKSDLYQWDNQSTYVKYPPYFEGMTKTPKPIQDINHARVLLKLGDSVTTDHISPAGSIEAQSTAGLYLQQHGIAVKDFNSYGSRRGNHEVMMRGTFANIRLKNQLAPGTTGGITKYLPTGAIESVFEASEKYLASKTPLIILAGKEYGTGSSRDWAAKGTLLLGVRSVIAQSFERIHRSNLIGMGVLPLKFMPNESAETLGLAGEELFSIPASHVTPRQEITVTATHPSNNSTKTFKALVCIDTPKELKYYEHGGILQYVIRQLLK
jgi:aconitate hydratase